MSTETSGAERVQAALPRGIRAPLAAAGLLGAVVAVTMGVMFAGQATGSGPDSLVAAALDLRKTDSSAAYAVSWIVQTLFDPIPAVVLILLLASACLLCGQRRLAALAVAGPAAADAIVIFMKHVVGRTIHDGSLTFPSTHTAHSSAFAMVTGLLAAAVLNLEARAAAALVLGAAAVTALAMGWALVAGNVHYATDTLAGFCVAIAVVPAAAWCTDLVGSKISAARRVRTPA
jgi:membrane-associated phospholipid phosphatase